MDKLLKAINEIRSNKDLPPIELLQADLDLRTDLGFDSLNLAELTVKIERDYGIDVFENGLVATLGEVMTKLTKNG